MLRSKAAPISLPCVTAVCVSARSTLPWRSSWSQIVLVSLSTLVTSSLKPRSRWLIMRSRPDVFSVSVALARLNSSACLLMSCSIERELISTSWKTVRIFCWASSKRWVSVSALVAAVSAAEVNSRLWLRSVAIMRSALATTVRGSLGSLVAGVRGPGARRSAQARAGRPNTAVTRLAISAGVDTVFGVLTIQAPQPTTQAVEAAARPALSGVPQPNQRVGFASAPSTPSPEASAVGG